jgi:hypothetical protein
MRRVPIRPGYHLLSSMNTSDWSSPLSSIALRCKTPEMPAPAECRIAATPQFRLNMLDRSRFHFAGNPPYSIPSYLFVPSERCAGPVRGRTRRADRQALASRCRSAALRTFAGRRRQGLNTSNRRTSSAWRWVSVLSKTCCRWVRTVVYEIDNSPEISFRSAPCITCRATSASASVRR